MADELDIYSDLCSVPKQPPARAPVLAPASTVSGGTKHAHKPAPGPKASQQVSAARPASAVEKPEKRPFATSDPRPAVRARNLVWTPAPAGGADDVLKVLNTGNAGHTGLARYGPDLYGDLALDPRSRPVARAAAAPAAAAPAVATFPEERTPERRPRARNLVWKPAPAQAAKPEVVVLDDDEPAENPADKQIQQQNPEEKQVQPHAEQQAQQQSSAEKQAQQQSPAKQTQQQEAALQKALEEEPAQQDQPGSPVSDAMMEEDAVISDDEEEVGFHLGEVCASETGVAARREGTGANRSGPPLPTVPCAQRAPDCFMLVAGVPAWLTDAELRKHFGQFGQVRNLRIMVDLSTGKSAGVVLVEYTEPEAVKKATRVDGICRLRILQGFGIVPRAMQVGPELHGKLCEGTVPWPDGGSCSDELRGLLLEKFGMRTRPKRLAPPPKRPQSEDVDWHQKLKKLKSVVRPASPPKMPQAQAPAPQGGWADKLKNLKGSVNSRRDRA